jgi:type VI secretion system protein ImpF
MAGNILRGREVTMAIDYQTETVPSILDRLVDTPADGQIGSAAQSAEARLVAAIANDLGILLNTRRQEELVPPEFEQVTTSIVNFGLPDIMKLGLRSTTDQTRLRRWIEEAIRTFEPRLTSVSVKLVGWEQNNPVLRFRVEAEVLVDGGTESVSFEPALKGDSGKFVVQGQRR